MQHISKMVVSFQTDRCRYRRLLSAFGVRTSLKVYSKSSTPIPYQSSITLNFLVDRHDTMIREENRRTVNVLSILRVKYSHLRRMVLKPGAGGIA